MADNLFSENKKIIDLTLTRIACVLEHFGNPQNKVKTIHIAGTNGKGSTANIINSVLMNVPECKKVGLYTSPHLFSYFERIRINNENIAGAEFRALKKEVEETSLALGVELTEFEILTAICFIYFARESVDIAIIEVGLGGRFDATNVIEAPICSVITSISLDHTERLGTTIGEVAFEKAGIIKTNVPTVVARDNKGYETIALVARDKGSPLREAGADIEIIKKDGENFAQVGGRRYEFGLEGEFQAQNLALALRALECVPYEILDTALCKGLKNVKWKFRAEYIKEKNLLIDGCHNPDGARVLREYLDKNFANYKKRFIWGSLAHKDWQSVLKTLVRKGDELIFYHFDYPNSLEFEEVCKCVGGAVELFDPQREIASSQENTLTIVCGSLYMLGKIFKKPTKVV